MEENQQLQEEIPKEEPKKYAGKFETVEDLEEGYKNSAKVYQENENLKKQLDSFKAPEAYDVPAGVQLDENQIADLQESAKESGLTQTQFEKLLHKTYYKTIKQKENLENKVKALGEEEVNLLKDYVNKQFSDQAEEVKVTLLEKYIMDDKARTVALNHRNKILNTAIPGISQINPASYAVNYEDVLKAREAANKNPSNRRLQEKYINLTAAYSNQNKAQ